MPPKKTTPQADKTPVAAVAPPLDKGHVVTCPDCNATLSGPDESAIARHLKEHRESKHPKKDIFGRSRKK